MRVKGHNSSTQHHRRRGREALRLTAHQRLVRATKMAERAALRALEEAKTKRRKAHA